MKKYGCVRTDNMSGTVIGRNLVSLKYEVSGTDSQIENGNIVVIGDLLSGEREVRKATPPIATSKLATLALVASEEVVKDKDYNGLSDFINEAGDIIRGYRLTSKDVFSVTKEALDIASGYTVKVGDVVEATAGTKMKVVATLTTSSTQIGNIIAIEGDWYVIEVM